MQQSYCVNCAVLRSAALTGFKDESHCLLQVSNEPLSLCLQHSYREVGILLLYLAVGVSVFSGITYTAEYEEVKSDVCSGITQSFPLLPEETGQIQI